jgi:hypothetical protein
MEPQFNKFVTFSLNPEEQTVGETFNPMQTAVIQNRRAQIALDILNLKAGKDFFKNKTFLDGQMAVMDWMIEVSARHNDEAAEEALKKPQST